MKSLGHQGRVDANQAEIVDGLRKAGCSVLSLAKLGQGVPDLLVARAGHLWLLEVKTAGGRIRSSQSKWAAQWNAPVLVVRNLQDALWAVGLRVGIRPISSST